MSVTVYLYSNGSDRRTAVKNLTLISTETCEFKGDVDVLRPVLIMEGAALTNIATLNYVDIPDLGRSYFASAKILPGGLVEISCEVDVLSTAWDYIKIREAVIARQEHDYNLYLNDGTFQAYANEQVVTKEFSGGFSSPAYVLVLAGG